jgi:hypothetical protein
MASPQSSSADLSFGTIAAASTATTPEPQPRLRCLLNDGIPVYRELADFVSLPILYFNRELIPTDISLGRRIGERSAIHPGDTMFCALHYSVAEKLYYYFRTRTVWAFTCFVA